MAVFQKIRKKRERKRERERGMGEAFPKGPSKSHYLDNRENEYSEIKDEVMMKIENNDETLLLLECPRMESPSIKSCPTPLREESPNRTDPSSHPHASMLLLRVTPSKGQSEQHGLGKATSNPVWQRKRPKCSWWDIKFYQGLGINRFPQNRLPVISDSWYF